MSKRTRLFVLVASAVLLVGLGTAGVASYVGLNGLGILASSASDELAYIPAGAEMVGFADVRHVMDSELGTKLQSRLVPHTQGSPDNVFTQTGIDIRKDVDSIVVASLSAGTAGGDMPLMLARGEFDQPRIESLIVSHGGEVSHHQGIRMVTLQQPEIGVGFLESRLVAVGHPAAVRLAVETKTAGTGSVKNDADLMRLVHRVENGSTWTVAKFDALRRRQQLPAQLAVQLPAITWFAASGQIDRGVSATLLAETRDEKAAQDLRSVIQGLLALGRMQVGQHPDLANFVNSVELTGEGTSVSVAFSIPLETLDKLTALGAEHAAPPPSGISGRPLAPSNVRPRPTRSI